jgi:hypothetical protein
MYYVRLPEIPAPSEAGVFGILYDLTSLVSRDSPPTDVKSKARFVQAGTGLGWSGGIRILT